MSTRTVVLNISTTVTQPQEILGSEYKTSRVAQTEIYQCCAVILKIRTLGMSVVRYSIN